ncbi:MAG: DUF3782 domain-containing protein [bacterium]
MAIDLELYKTIETIVEEKTKGIKVDREEFNLLANEVRKLAIAQRETQKEVNRLDKALQELAEAQKRTEQRVEELAEAQKRTEQRVEELAEAQKKTNQRLGGISDTIGYELEEKYYSIFPYVLKEDFEIKVEKEFERRFFIYPDGNEDEINIYAEATKNGKKIYIIGESKASIGKNDIKDFSKLIKRARNYLKADIFPFFLCYSIHPNVEAYLKKEYPHIKLYRSYELSRRAREKGIHL